MAKIIEVKRSTPRGRVPFEVGVGVGIATALLVLGIAGPAAAGSDGIECATRGELREVFRDQFVLDRVTRCWVSDLPMAASEAVAGAPHPESSAGDSLESAPGEARIATAATRAEWRAGRRLLANAQYGRSLRAIGEIRLSPRR